MKKAHLRGTSSWAAFQQTGQKKKRSKISIIVFWKYVPPNVFSSLWQPCAAGGGRPAANWDPNLLHTSWEGSHLSALTPLERDRWRQGAPHPRREKGEGGGGGRRKREVHLRASFGAVTHLRLCVWMNVALPVFPCVCICRSVFMHIHVEACTLSVCSLCPTVCCSFQVFSRVCNRVWPLHETLTTMTNSFAKGQLIIIPSNYGLGKYTKCPWHMNTGHTWLVETYKD